MNGPPGGQAQPEAAGRRTGFAKIVTGVALLNLGYFGIECAMALRIGSVSLFADCLDFLEDAAVNLLILIGLGWGIRNRARLGALLAGILLMPGLAMLWTAWDKFQTLAPPAPLPVTLTGAGALAVNLACAFLLAPHRDHGGSLSRAAFLSARNDAVANLGIILAGFVTAAWRSGWPDLCLGIAIAVMNADAARSVLAAAKVERSAKGDDGGLPPA